MNKAVGSIHLVWASLSHLLRGKQGSENTPNYHFCHGVVAVEAEPLA
uniref:Uncharacterized protein n=1 Tax=Rhizophora mucronata TaxID=61149 RepID=A0A2P2R1Q7_RHIMU